MHSLCGCTAPRHCECSSVRDSSFRSSLPSPQKPQNCLVNANCDLKIGDLGSCSTMSRNQQKPSNRSNVTTLWYRSPEVIRDSDYSPASDVWAVGCIMAELFTGQVLFPGEDASSQLELIAQGWGGPAKANQADSSSTDKPLRIPELLPESGFDLIVKMLASDPGQRIRVDQALSHPYFASLHDSEDEPVAQHPFRSPKSDQDSDSSEASVED